MRQSFKSMILGGAVLFGLSMCLTSCDPYLDDIFGDLSRPTGNNGNTKTTVAVKSVTLDQTTLTQTVGDAAVTLTATVTPDDATDKTVKWTSSNESVATVADGVVTFVAAGTATITATAPNGTDDTADDKTAECAVTVNAAAVPVTSVKLDEANLRFVKTDLTAQTLTATVTPSDATDKTVTWTSSDEAVATVANGVVTPVAPGEAIITAKAGDKTATSTVYVYDKIYNLSSGWTTVTAGEFWLIEGTGDLGLTIGDGAKITLNNIKMVGNLIGCNGDATIILADGSTNTISAPSYEAGIKPADGSTKTLIIDAETAGTGKLMVEGGESAAGIGTEYNTDCGNIEIKGGVITAQGGQYGAGIGSSTGGGSSGNCGKITISGGTIKAVGGANAAGIGGGKDKYCKDINITTGVTSVIATKGTDGAESIGKGGANIIGTIKFGTATVFESSTWSPNPMVSGTYGGLNLVISTTNTADDTWTLTPAP